MADNGIDRVAGKRIFLLDMCAMICSLLLQGQANANDWVAEAVKDVNMLGRSSSTGLSPVGGTGLLTDTETAATLLPILQAQRERFRYIKLNLIHIKWRTCVSDWRGCWRQRNQELEEQNLEQQQQMALLHSEVERLRTDNVALYEKVRFLQSYSGNQVCTGMFDWLKIVYKPRCLRENFGLVDSALPRIPAPLVQKRRNSTNVSTRIVSILSPRSLAGSGNVN